MKIYLKALTITFILITSFILILTIFHYFNLIGDNLTSIFKVIIGVISISIGGFIVGLTSDNKGWLAGLKLSLIVIVIMILFMLIFRLEISLKTTLYWLIIIASSTLGSMIGISLNQNKEQE